MIVCIIALLSLSEVRILILLHYPKQVHCNLFVSKIQSFYISIVYKNLGKPWTNF